MIISQKKLLGLIDFAKSIDRSKKTIEGCEYETINVSLTIF